MTVHCYKNSKHIRHIPDKQPFLRGCRCQFSQSSPRPSSWKTASSTIVPACDATAVSETVLLWWRSAATAAALSTPASPRLRPSLNSVKTQTMTMMMTTTAWDVSRWPPLHDCPRVRSRCSRPRRFCHRRLRRRPSTRPPLSVSSSPAALFPPRLSAAPAAPLKLHSRIRRQNAAWHGLSVYTAHYISISTASTC